MHERYLVCSVARFGVGSNAGMIWVPVTMPAFKSRHHGRRVATRYDKLAANYLAFIKLAAIRIWLRAYESTP
jgi:hypothetical protein